MYQRNYRDIVGGFLLVLLGLSMALYSSAHYAFGTVFEMGPGMFPTALGYLMAGLGVLVALPAFFKPGPRVEIEWRPMLAILVAVLVFWFGIDRVGLVPAVCLSTIAAALADNKLGVVATVVLAAVLAALAVAIFVIGLSIPVSIAKWPF